MGPDAVEVQMDDHDTRPGETSTSADHERSERISQRSAAHQNETSPKHVSDDSEASECYRHATRPQQNGSSEASPHGSPLPKRKSQVTFSDDHDAGTDQTAPSSSSCSSSQEHPHHDEDEENAAAEPPLHGPQHQPEQLDGEGERLGRKRPGDAMEVSSTRSSSEPQDGASTSTSEKGPALPQHEQLLVPQQVEPLDISYTSTPASIKLKETLVTRLSMVAPTGRIQVIDLSRRGLGEDDAELISAALRGNPQLAVLKVGYNNLGDKGSSIIASSCSRDGRHHQSLTVLDLGFNNIGDEGCTAISLHMLAGNHTLRNLFLSGNSFKEKGALALAGAILHGCSLSRLHLSANQLGPNGIKVLAQAIAEAEARIQQLLQRQGGIKIGYNIKPVTLEELHVDDISMGSEGCATLASMLMTNYHLKILSLASNDLEDRDIALLSQAFSKNKNVPLTSLVLSFNKITCVGVECLMNAVWGSKTLREIRLDNNKMQDRGAQLCSVVLGSIRLEVLDISFNRISTVGIKAIMKSLSENDSLQRLSLSGIPIDQNASKAVSYALAYNHSLQTLNIDSCSVGYSGQRHIVAGIVSNRNVKLRVLTGFPLGPITMTLGLPQLPEDWGNDRVLSFVRFMWAYRRSTKVPGVAQGMNIAKGPAPPSLVASSGKAAFASLSKSDEAKMQFQSEHQNQTDDCPMISPDTSILVRSSSGQNLQMPLWDDQLQQVAAEAEADFAPEESWSSETDSFDRSSYTGSSESLQNAAAVNYEKRNRNLAWLRAHLQSLNEVGNLPFNNADLWQLHQYFFSPAYTAEDDTEIEYSEAADDGVVDEVKESKSDSIAAPPPTPAPAECGKAGMGRTISFQTLGKAVAKAAAEEAHRPNKRGSLDEELKYDGEPSAKRAKNLKPRIAYYPRIRERLESLGAKPSAQTLSLLRRLKYMESVMLRGRNIYTDREQEQDGPTASDAEMVLLDLL